jgi:surface polysaccharide O-acyltransferase-like enzyme
VTIGLFVFGFSSGFFTASKYRGDFSKRIFWSRKVKRLAFNLIIINLFLFLLFVYRGYGGVYSWQTLVSLFGLTGFLEWFHIPNESPFGNALWFFTLLLIFYGAYPLLERINRNRVSAYLTILCFAIIASILHYITSMGHMLWMTAISFAFGVFSRIHRVSVKPYLSVISALGIAATMLYANIVTKMTALNYFFILGISVAVVFFLLEYKLPTWALGKMTILSGCVLEIYFIHTYLFVKSEVLPLPLNYVASVLITVTVAFALSHIAKGFSASISRLLVLNKHTA